MGAIVLSGVRNLFLEFFDKNIPEQKKVLDKKVNFPNVRDPHDFIQIPGTNYIISKYQLSDIESSWCYSVGVEHVRIRGMNMANPYLFIKHLYNLFDCLEANEPIFDAAGIAFSKEEAEDILYEIVNSPQMGSAYQGGIWLSGYHLKSEMNGSMNLLEMFSGKEIPQSISDDDDWIFIKDGPVNFGPFYMEDGSLKMRGGTGEGDGFMFYSDKGELYLNFKCNPNSCNYHPKAYGVLENKIFSMNLLASGSIVKK